MQINISTNPKEAIWLDDPFIAIVCDADTSRKIIAQNLQPLAYEGRIPTHVFSPESLGDMPFKYTWYAHELSSVDELKAILLGNTRADPFPQLTIIDGVENLLQTDVYPTFSADLARYRKGGGELLLFLRKRVFLHCKYYAVFVEIIPEPPTIDQPLDTGELDFSEAGIRASTERLLGIKLPPLPPLH